MQEHLARLGVAARRFLANRLPGLGEDWWLRGVIRALPYQQQQVSREQGWSSLEDLDVAALLATLDGDWEILGLREVLDRDARGLVKEARGLRNRYAHEPVGARRDPMRLYRDLDTLARLASQLDPGSEETVALEHARVAAFGVASTDVMSDDRQPSAQPFAPGSLVRLMARPEVEGSVMSVIPGSPESRVRVFTPNGPQSFFASQLESVNEAVAAVATASDLRMRLTSTQLLHPSTRRLYSFNSGRIEYEPYQFRPVMKLINAERPRILIADDVGVGKTIEAALIIKELQARQPLESILIICPRQLVTEDKWRSELKRFDEDFVALDSATLQHCIEETRLEGRWPSRYRKAIVPYSLLDEKLLLGTAEGRRTRPGLTSIMPPVTFDLVIVDEAHHIRNRETWNHRVVSHLLDAAEAAVLISATPIQTGSKDLFNLLRLLRPDLILDERDFDRMREPNAYLARAEQLARSGATGWQSAVLEELEGAIGTAWGSTALISNPRAQQVRDLIDAGDESNEMRVRVVRALQGLNTFSGIVNRTRRRDIGSFTTRKPETVEVEFTEEQARVYRDLISICERIVTLRQPSMSTEFLLSTLKRQASSSLNALAPFIEALLERRLSLEESSEADVEDVLIEPQVLEEFLPEIREIGRAAARLDADPKLDSLLEIAAEKRQLPNNKLLVFSTFRHTLRYLQVALERDGSRVGLVHGGVSDDERRAIRARFAADKDDPRAIDILLSSEVGTEGLDNQFCDALVNYDLPWNPMRIEQRIGRIDRRGQKSESISIKNMIVTGTIDAVIYQRCLRRIIESQLTLGASEEILGEITHEIRRIAEDLTLSDHERELRLQQLADNKLGRIQEQAELEEREAALFGLAVHKLDEDGVEEASSRWLAMGPLAGLVEEYLDSVGYERASGLFSRPIAVLRPDQNVRKALHEDYVALGSGGAPAVSWERWLKSPSEPTRRLAFDPAVADPDVELLSPTHPLVRAAASRISSSGLMTVSLQAVTPKLPPGRYPFAVYGWTTLGSKDDYDVKVVGFDPANDSALEDILLLAEDGSGEMPTERELSELDTRHYSAWLNERSQHIERTRLHLNGQRASLRASNLARIGLIEDQLASASHDSIRRMREGQLANTEEDFRRRDEQLTVMVDRNDITTRLLASGVVEVR